MLLSGYERGWRCGSSRVLQLLLLLLLLLAARGGSARLSLQPDWLLLEVDNLLAAGWLGRLAWLAGIG
jgi:hypothetical protein